MYQAWFKKDIEQPQNEGTVSQRNFQLEKKCLDKKLCAAITEYLFMNSWSELISARVLT